MIRVYNIGKQLDEIKKDLNNPYMRLIDFQVFHSSESEQTTTILESMETDEPRESRFIRSLKRFVIPHGRGKSVDYDLWLAQPEIRVIKKYTFFSGIGTVIVVDYQINKGR